MSTLYTYGEYVVLSPSEFNGYSAIQYAPGDTTSTVELGLSSSGSVNFSSRLGSRSAMVDGATGNDNLTLGGGNDSVWANAGNDTVYGGSGDDFLVGDWGDGIRTGDDRLNGGDGDDEMGGGLGNDSLDGGNGDDIFTIVDTNAGNDTFKGGAGTDSVTIWDARGDGTSRFDLNRLVLDAASSVEFLLIDSPGFDVGGTDGADVFDLGYAEGFTWIGGEWIAGVKVDLRLGSDRFDGGIGVETVIAHGGGDYISLGDGDDQLVLADGILAGDTINGGAGVDTLYLGPLDSSAGARTVTLSDLRLTSALGFETLHWLDSTTVQGTSEANLFDFSGLTEVENSWNQFIRLLGGNDSFVGSQGTDVIDGGDGNDRLEGGSGVDKLSGGAGADTIYGGADNDRLVGGGGNDALYGGDGDDAIHIGGPLAAAFTLDGGEGQDTVVLANGASFMELRFGTAQSIEFIDLAPDTIGQTLVYGTAEANAFDFRTLQGWQYNLDLRFDLRGGNDWIAGGLFQLNVMGGDGNDTLLGTGYDDTLAGGTGADSLAGKAGNDLYRVDNSGDVVVEVVNGGNDTVETGLGRYRLGDLCENLTHLGTNAFTGTGNAKANRMVGGGGADTLFGLLGADSLFGGVANDRLEGGRGADVLDGGLGVDTLVGGIGNDLYIVDNRSDVIIEQSGGGLDTVTCRTDVLVLSAYVDAAIVERTVGAQVTGNLLSNRITGGSGNDTLLGAYGNDVLTGGDGDDRLEGGRGNDTLSGQGGQNVLVGGDGNDLYQVDSASDVITETAGGGYDTIRTGLLVLTMGANVEELVNTALQGFTVYGNAQSNVIRPADGHYVSVVDHVEAMGGNDTLYGTSRDWLYGGTGDDTFILSEDIGYFPVVDGNRTIEEASQGYDTVYYDGNFSFTLPANVEALVLTNSSGWLAGSGNELDNKLTGSAAENDLDGGYAGRDGLISTGSDTMTGGGGADTFILNEVGSVDHITDYTVGQDDILLSASWGVFDGVSTGGMIQASEFKDLSTGPVDPTDRILFDPVSGSVYYDTDGSGVAAAVLFLILDNHATVTFADFFAY